MFIHEGYYLQVQEIPQGHAWVNLPTLGKLANNQSLWYEILVYIA
jgi:hypothetical protein